MRKKIALIGMLLVFGAATLTGCGEQKTIGDQELELAKNLKDKANDAVEQAQKTNPDDLLNSIPGE